MIKCFTIAALLAFIPSSALAHNFIINGNFESGENGFSSDYRQVSTLDKGRRAVWDEGTYTVGSNAADYHELFNATHDHGTGHGNYLIVNGALAPGVDAWRSSTIDLRPGVYRFSVWTTTLYDKASLPDLHLFGEGYGASLHLHRITTPIIVGPWQKTQFQMAVEKPIRGNLSLRDASTDAGGNDFGIDDIRLDAIAAPVPEMPVWLSMATGLGLAGYIARSRQRSPTLSA